MVSIHRTCNDYHCATRLQTTSSTSRRSRTEVYNSRREAILISTISLGCSIISAVYKQQQTDYQRGQLVSQRACQNQNCGTNYSTEAASAFSRQHFLMAFHFIIRCSLAALERQRQVTIIFQQNASGPVGRQELQHVAMVRRQQQATNNSSWQNDIDIIQSQLSEHRQP